MTSLRAKALLLILAFPLLWPLGNSAQAQSSNGDDCGDGSGVPWPDRGIGVCNLEDTTKSVTYNPGSTVLDPPIDFGIRSCSGVGINFGGQCNVAVAFTVRIDGPSSGNSFVLSGPGGSQALVGLTFVRDDQSEQLSPDLQGSAVFTGTAGLPQPASIDASLISNGINLLPGTYSETFFFSLVQEPWSQGFCQFFPPFCPSTDLTPIAFTVELIVNPEIRISGLSDMAIDANPAGLTEAQQTFCVYSQGGAPFGITAGSGNGNGSFLLAGNLDQIEYETWIEELSAGGLEQLTEGQPSALSWPGSLWNGCTGSGENMQISIRIQQNALANAVETSYTDTLTLTVELD